jgi:hypothetical protein
MPDNSTHSITTIKFARFVLRGLIWLSILVLCYLFYHHMWFRDRQFATATAAWAWYSIPCCVALVGRALLQREYRVQIAFAKAVAGLLFIFYGAELVLFSTRAGSKGPLSWRDDVEVEKTHAIVKMAAGSGTIFDTRPRPEVVLELRRRGIDAVTGMMPLVLLREGHDGKLHSLLKINGAEVIQLGNFAKKTIVFCNESGEYVTYRSDEHGFRNPAESWTYPRLEVAAVGNSFAAGGCVPTGQAFVELVRNRHSATLNLAMGGDGPLFELATLKEYLPHFLPKKVLWFYEEDDDLSALVDESKSPLLLRYLEPNFNQGLFGLRSKIDQFMASYDKERMPELLRKAAQAKNKRQQDDLIGSFVKQVQLYDLRDKFDVHVWSEKQVLNLKLLGKVLSEAKRSVNTWNGSLYFVYLPTYGRYAGQPSPYREAREAVLDLVREQGIPIIDIDPAFRAQKDPLSLFPFRRFVHYNRYGHQLVADELLRAIDRKGW